MTQVATAERDLILDMTRRFRAPRELVFDMWTKREHLVKWWGPQGMTTPECEMDVRVGGHWRTVMRSSEGNDYIVSGVYKEISPPSKLVFTWGWETEGSRGHESTITLEFVETKDGTIVNLHQAFLDSKDSRDSHEGGWASSFADLERALAEAQES